VTRHTNRHPDRSWVLRGLAAVLAAALALSAGFLLSPWGERFLQDPRGQNAVVGATTIRLVESVFDPPVSQVATGTTVTFLWDDGANEHDVVFDDGPASELLRTGSYQRTFTDAGTYDYTCTLHPFMDGRIVVVDP
jgi:plastocyanin